jgi:predicted DCC family thiol-disulfide oxidoreductase YuxK
VIENRRAIPLLIYDGDCGICGEWVAHWRKLTGERIDYRPYQNAASEFPDIGIAEFRAAIQFIDTDGSRCSGAAATYMVYRGIGAWSALDKIYRQVPGFALVSEFFYHFFARRRGLLARLTHLVRGRNFQPPAFRLTSWVFLRILGCLYFSAMASYAVQARILIGSDGILPLTPYLQRLRDNLGAGYWHRVPMLFWLDHSDTFIQWLPIAGCLLALAVIFNLATRAALIGLFVIYLSLLYAGQTFMTFQWDLELLEAGMLAILLTSGSRIVIWLYRWLAFRFIFLGGVVKILSGDSTWRNLTALNYYFETEPLPTPLAWYAHHLPEWMLKAGVAGTLTVELVLPFLIFAPRRLRMFAACCFILLQSTIVLTGNYNWFNLLTITLCLFLFDDAALRRWIPGWMHARIERHASPRPWRATTAGVWILSTVILFSSSELLLSVFSPTRLGSYSLLTRAIGPCQCVNNYGPFAVITHPRYEIVIEGSADGQTWKEYDFKYKPGDLARRPEWIIPHQPRVDWQMWFAALGEPSQNPWFTNLLVRILRGNKTEAALFRVDPFPDAPPQWVRAQYYLYHFTTPGQRAETGNWWTRELVGQYFPPVRLNVPAAGVPRGGVEDSHR